MPRVFLIGYSVLIHQMIMWVMVQPDITSPQAILVSAIITMATPLTKFYIDSGDKLYEYFSEIEHNNSFIAIIDTIGYMTDKWRIFPLFFVVHFAVTFVIAVFWAFGLGQELTNAQATFISIYGGNAALVLGFFITTDNKNKELEDQYLTRHLKRIEQADKIIDESDTRQ